MKLRYNNTILLMLDLQVGFEEPVRDLLARFPEGNFSAILDSCAPGSVVDKFRNQKIIRYNIALPWLDKVRLLRDLRCRRFSKAYFIGDRYDLRQIAAVWFTGAKERVFIRTNERGGRCREKRIHLSGLLLAGLFRLAVFFILLPWLIALRFLFVGGTASKKKPVSADSLPPLVPDHPAVSVVIPNYNGRDLLEECLPSVVSAMTSYRGGAEIILVDDASTDESVAFVRERFPSVRIVALLKNRGFGRASDIGIKRAANHLVLLLNSDIAVTESFLGPLVNCFKDSNVFGVQPRAYFPGGKRLNVGLNVGRLDPGTGYIQIWNEADTEEDELVDRLCPTLYCLGGAMLFDRRKYRALGGFDDLFYPFRWEDIDLCYRAAKRGWRVLYQPESVVYHKHHATLNKVFSPDYLNIIEQKNELLFIWKNLHDRALITLHLRKLPPYLLSMLLSGRYNFCRGLIRAMGSLPLCLARRDIERREAVKRDSRVLTKPLRLYRNFLRGDKKLGEGRRRQILILNPVFPYPPIDGGKTRVYNLLREAARTNDIHLLCFIEDDQKQDLPHLREICRSVTTVDFPAPLGYLGLFQETLYPMYYRRFYCEEMRDKLADILQTRPIDIVQMEFDKMLYWVNYVRDIPTLYIEHDVASLFLKGGKNPPLGGWEKIIDIFEWMRSQRWEVVMGRKYTKIAALSPQDEEVVRSFLPGADICSVKHGTNVEEFSLEYREVKTKSLLFVGSLVHYPNVEAIQYFYNEIWPLVKKEVPEGTLTIVGSHPTEEILRLGEEPAIEVTGFVEDVRPYLDRAAVFIAPMRKGFGMKGKILEAMVRAKPVVTTSIGIRGAEVVSGTHLLVGDTPDDFAGSVVELLVNSKLRREIAVAGYELVRNKYDWSSIAEELDVIYREILS
jgi:GT2 family glycosyltransferase/glycosyltransferase involved in cell wall biosynthesis